MARMPSEMIIRSEPNTALVDILCNTIECEFNLFNAANVSENREARCNLKCILIINGKCKNFSSIEQEKMKDNFEKWFNQ